MNNYLLSYREVIPDLTNPEKWKDISLINGGTQSTLQDIKVVEKAGGYSYKDSSIIHNRNRFIYWRTTNDILELSEISLDYNLTENSVRYKFSDSSVLSVDIFETENLVVILVATIGSLHRLNFTHPSSVNKNDLAFLKPFSIFNDVSAHSAVHPSTFHIIGQSTSTNNPIPHTASCWLSSSGNEAYFALAFQSSIILFTMNSLTSHTSVNELKTHNFVPRIISNITDALRGKRNIDDSQYATSLIFESIGNLIYLYALYRDDHIRMWSTKNNQCISSVNCLQDGIEPKPQGPQTNILRKISPTSLCAFLCHAAGSKFVSIEIVGDGATNSFSMIHKNIVAAPEYDLIDFEIIDSRIWGLWCNSHGEFNVSSHILTPCTDRINWITAAMEPPPDRYCISLDRGIDPRQAYCSYIFHPGKFQKHVISKALTMFRRTNIIFDLDLPIAILKDRVCQAVEIEVQNEIKDYDISDEQFLEVSLSLWEKFYSCCEQYHLKSCQPIGLFQLNVSGGICIVKRNMFTILRPCDTLEHLMLARNNGKVEDLIGTEFSNNIELCEDLIQLVSILAYIEEHLTDDVKVHIDKQLYQLQLPNDIISKLISDSNEYDESILSKEALDTVHERIQLINDFSTTMVLLLDLLRMDHGQTKENLSHSKLSRYSSSLLSLGQLFGSNCGISFLSETLRQTVLVRYSLSRNILILQMLLIDVFKISSTQMEMIRSRSMSETILFVQAYYVIVWLCETSVNSTSTAAALEISMQRLNILQLSDSRNHISRVQHSMSLLELFLRGTGAQISLGLFAAGPYQQCQELHWQYTLLPLINIIGQQVWAVSGNFVFGEWLIGSCQHVLIQEYVRLLNSWCEWNNSSRDFILAVSLLDNGERKKALNLFMQADRGVLTEQFLIEKILQKNEHNLVSNDAIAEYYLKVIQLFEQYNALDCVIMMANAAINILNTQDLKLAMFQSIVFSNHLELGHYEEAYDSLIHNVEPLRRKDCLSQLVVNLFQELRLDLLMNFPYIGLQDELEIIIESRARASVVEDNYHYDFLYSFHITKGNMRKASSIMYEKAMRYFHECVSVKAMESRYHSLLASINALNLVDTKYAWIAKPVINDEHQMEDDQLTLNEKVIVLEIKDLKKELLQTESVLLVAKYKDDIESFLQVGAEELIAILSSLNLYSSAARLSKAFDLNISPVLESLTIACVNASQQDSHEPWKWLTENDITELPTREDAIETTWNLLKHLLFNYELENSTTLHKAITKKILTSGAFLPEWLYQSYKVANTPELLTLFVSNGRLIEATQLAKEYIRAMLEGGIEYFGIKNTLNSTLPSLCFPINTIDLLLYGLKLNYDNEDQEYEQCYIDLNDIVKNYITTVRRVSHDKLHYEYKSKVIR